MRVAFLGLGRMGRPMARHVLDAGHELTVWNRSPQAAEPLVAAGARAARDAADAVADAEVVVVVLFGPDAVREVLARVGPSLHQGALVIDATTIGPADAREFAATLATHGVRYVDAPVAGSVAPATAGTLGVLVGGRDDDVSRARPLLELWGDPQRIRHVGPVGAGSAMKLVNNLALGVAMAGVGEGLRLAADLGLDRSQALDVLAGGPLGWSVGQKREMLEHARYGETAFSLDLMTKDLRLAAAAGERRLPVTAAVLDVARAAVEAARGGEDYAVLAEELATGSG